MRYGWIPDLPTRHPFGTPEAISHLVIPPHSDMRPKCPPVYDQEDRGSCTGNAIAAIIQMERRRQNLLPDFIPSRLFIYFNERVMEGTVDSDSGAMLHDGIRSVAKEGVCPETEWPYDVNAFANQPPPSCYTDAVKFRALNYWRVPRSLMQMRGCLAAGYPFVFGFTVYESFESDAVAQSGVVPMPWPNEEALGGHACVIVGHDDPMQRFIARNSWGTGWGQAGYFTIPYAYVMDQDLASDFWCIKLES